MSAALEIAALARLIEMGVIKAGSRNDFLIQRFETACWIVEGTRKSEWLVRSEAVSSVEERLENLLPSWRQEFVFLRSIGRDPFDPSDLEALPMLRRQVRASKVKINRRNWNAAVGLGPKHRAKVPAQSPLTKDWILRFRPNKGLRLANDAESTGEIDLSAMAKSWTECVVPERAWMGLSAFRGEFPALIITCENLGAYIDLPVHDSTLVVYSPGADTEPAIGLLKLFPATRWMHFGDLDPEGIDIAQRIAEETGKAFSLFIPFFAEDYLDAAKPVKSAWGSIPHIPLILKLKEMKKRIFQEVFMLDERLKEAMDRAQG